VDYGAYFELPEAVTLHGYMKTITEALNSSGTISINNPDNTLRKVFSRADPSRRNSFLPLSTAALDVVISGEIKHHVTVLLAHEGILSVIAGHNATERVFMENITSVLKKAFPDVSFYYNAGSENVL
jgi:Uncharacterized conserved protein